MEDERPRISVLLADPHALFREAMRVALARDPELAIVAEAESGRDAVAEAERVLRLIQTFDPAGVGARSLQECLLIQARALEAEEAVPPRVVAILERYWKELCASKWRAIARGLRCPVEEVRNAVSFIRQHLSPYPGSRFRLPWDRNSHRSAQAIRPDVIIKRGEKGEFVVEVVESDHVQLHLNPGYVRLWQELRERPDGFTPAETRHIQEYLHRAQMFLKALQDRKHLLQQVTETIVEEQRAFFETEREEDMVPFTQSQLAGLLRVHESTISRCVAEKFMQLPSGRVVPLSYFFDRSLSLRRLVANVVATEDPAHPYSDQQISEILREMGYVVARRTVMKYREDLNILSSRQRARHEAP